MANTKVGAEATVATRTDTAIAAGLGNHLPIGDYSGADYRSAVRFPVPAGWANWTAITKATISFYISDFQHVGPKNSSIFCSRMNISTPVWSKAAGTQSCESGFTAGNTTQFDDIASTATDRVTFSSGTTENKAITLDVTAAMRYYWSNGNGVSKPVFVFDNNGAGQYTELWSDQKTGGFDLVLSIDYETSSPPTAPTLNAPAANAVVASQTPTFSWTHHDPQGDPQTGADILVSDPIGGAGGAFIQYTWHPVNPTDQTLVAPISLPRRGSAVPFSWQVRTYDASGAGAWSAEQDFIVAANPVVTIDPARAMVFANGAPRLQVNWSCDQPQGRYRVQVASPAFDSGWLTGSATSYVLATQPVVDNVAQSITVTVENTDASPLQGAATRSFTPRYGLTTHRRDLGSAPLGWGVPSTVATVPPGADIHFEYGSAATALAAPATWFSLMSSVPLAQFLYWRAWFIPSATAGPVLDYVNIPTDATAALVDDWGTTRDTPGLTGVWSVSKDEYVYGSRALTAKVTGAGPFYAYSYKVPVKGGRSYLLTALMQSVGNSGACVELQDASGAVLKGGGVTFPPNSDMRTEVLTADRPWFSASNKDVNRYRTPVFLAPSNMDVYVVLKAGGAAGSQAWFDATKLEESTVATPWSPGAVGSVIVDSGGVQVDGSKGGIFRLRGSGGLSSDEVTLGVHGLEQGGVPLLPPGVVIPYAAAAAPNGWLLCQGQSLLRTDYPALFTAIGVVFGSVDGTHFTLPDMRQKFPMGVAAAGVGNALGAAGGSIDHIHPYTGVITHTHLNSFGNSVGTGTPDPIASFAQGPSAGRFGSSATWQTTTPPGAATQNTQGGNPPFIALNYIIKT